jgi:hypothetical protein
MVSAESRDKKTKKEKKREPYQRPAIIYEGFITTRAGSPINSVPDGDRTVDPADLFGDGG